jgi:hypothetical protein
MEQKGGSICLIFIFFPLLLLQFYTFMVAAVAVVEVALIHVVEVGGKKNLLLW